MRAPVSVVVPCFRSADTIERAIRSVVDQTTTPEEVILVDDASPDDGATVAALHAIRERLCGQLDVRVIELAQNGGPGRARNAGWNAATQPYVAFLDSDDAWHPRKIELQAQWMQAHPDVAISAHRYRVLQPDERPDWSLPMRWKPIPISYHRLLLLNVVATPVVMLERSLPHRFPEHLRRAEDFSLWLRILSDGHRVVMLDVPLACLFKDVFGSSGLSADLWDMERAELQMYTELVKERRLKRRLYVPLLSWSLLKFGRRALLSSWRQVRSRG